MEATTKKSRETNPNNTPSCLSQWYNQKYVHQKRLGSFLEHPLFHLLIILLVFAECACVVTEMLLHNVKSQYECKINTSSYLSKEQLKKTTYHLERGIQICHYISLSILSVFIFELLLKMYALGYHYWNYYFDAFLAVFSFTTEIYFLIIDKESFIAHSAILIVVLRLWHLLRIANAVDRCFQKKEEFKIVRRQRHAARSSQALIVPSSIQAILNLMQEKTERLRRDITVEQSLVDRFEEIDQKCQDAFDDYYGNETQLLGEIQKLHLITRAIRRTTNHSISV